MVTVNVLYDTGFSCRWLTELPQNAIYFLFVRAHGVISDREVQERHPPVSFHHALAHTSTTLSFTLSWLYQDGSSRRASICLSMFECSAT